MIISPQKYPIGVETFSEIIEGGYAYVDKTEVIYRLTQSGKYFFLSRPRRFGKSLMLSTMQAYFEGRKELFEGLWLGQAQGVDWSSRPVFRLNFISATSDTENLDALLHNQFSIWENEYGVAMISKSMGQRFRNIITKAYEVTGRRVVVLIDEYDKVLVNTMYNPDLHDTLKGTLKSVFSILKEADRYIEFAILTGVSRFSKLSIFSDINNLRDISMSDQFCTICGITEEELRVGFKEGISSFADKEGVSFEKMLKILKYNYDGYHFSKNCPDIYNPFSLINALEDKEILHRWFESGTPSFLLERIRNSDEDINEILAPIVSANELINTSITDSNLTNILYQTGYLTIKSYDPEDDEFTLGLPNKEVANGIYKNLLPFYTGKDVVANDNVLRKIRKCINVGDAEGFMKILQSFMAGIPYSLTENKNERYFENNLLVILYVLGVNIQTEVETSDGRIDAVIRGKNYIYILELKLNGTAEDAIEQIRRKRYNLPSQHDGRPIICLGISFSTATHTIDRWIID